MEPVVCVEEYVGAEGDITLDVVVGEGHRGDILVLLDFEEKGHGTDQIHLDLGPASELSGRTIKVRVRVAPANPQSDRTSVHCTLRSDAGEDLEHDCPGPKPEDGTPIPFEIDCHVQ